MNSSMRASFLQDDCFREEDVDANLDASSNDNTFTESFPSDVGESNPFRKHRTSSSTFNATLQGKYSSPNDLAAEIALGVADNFRQMLPQSLLEQYNNKDCMGPFQPTEIVLGRKLGSGEFSHVFEIRSFIKDESLEPYLSDDQRNIRNYMKIQEKYQGTTKACYALKHLRQELITKYDEIEYAQAASDLAMEAEFLQSLQHPNIIKLRGISFAGPKGFEQGPKGFFLIIDRLDETLEMRLRKWERAKKRIRIKGSNGDVPVTEKQWDVCLRIAAALVYLHERNIIFRDLKPANVGFDVRGDVKLFDFGLATIVRPEGDPYQDTYEMSGAGSPRYMAPEVLKEEPDPYNLKADVYTFSIVTWQILTLQQPFSFVRSKKGLVDHVVNKGGRPEIQKSWPDTIKERMSDAFDADMGKRPSMASFYESIRFQLLDGAALEKRDAFRNSVIHSRRSTYFGKSIDGEVVSKAKEEVKASRGMKAKLNKSLNILADKFKGRRFSDSDL